MDDLLELRIRLLELSYKYNKDLKTIMGDFGRIGIRPAQPAVTGETKEKK